MMMLCGTAVQRVHRLRQRPRAGTRSRRHDRRRPARARVAVAIRPLRPRRHDDLIMLGQTVVIRVRRGV